jgi:putative flippase GtrA
MRGVRGSAVFFAGVIAQTLVLVLFFTSSIGYLWYNVIGCVAVLLFAWILQQTVFRNAQRTTIR